jgi:hypothetical protein
MPETKFYTHKELQKNIVFRILIFNLFDTRHQDERFRTEWYQALPEFNQI